MGSKPRPPPTRKEFRAIVLGGLVGVAAISLGWFVVMRPSLVEAVLSLVCTLGIFLLIIGFALVANGKEWRRAVLSRTKTR